MGLLKAAPPKRLQLFHHDNGDLEFRRMEIVGQSATEFDHTKQPVAAWIDYYQTLYPFNGYKNVPADAVQLAYGRHFHLEIHDILPEDLRPPDDDALDSPFMSAIAENRAAEILKTAKPRTIYESMTILLGAAFIIELLIWGLSYVT